MSPAQSDAVMAKHINNATRYQSRIRAIVLTSVWGGGSQHSVGYGELVKVQCLAHGHWGL